MKDGSAPAASRLAVWLAAYALLGGLTSLLGLGPGPISRG